MPTKVEHRCEREIREQSHGRKWKICGRPAVVRSDRETRNAQYSVYYCRRHEKHAYHNALRSIRVIAIVSIPDRLNLDEDPQILASLPRNVWSPWHGYGRLVGSIGRAPAIAHIARFERIGRPTAHHASAFFILN